MLFYSNAESLNAHVQLVDARIRGGVDKRMPEQTICTRSEMGNRKYNSFAARALRCRFAKRNTNGFFGAITMGADADGRVHRALL